MIKYWIEKSIVKNRIDRMYRSAFDNGFASFAEA